MTSVDGVYAAEVVMKMDGCINSCVDYLQFSKLCEVMLNVGYTVD